LLLRHSNVEVRDVGIICHNDYQTYAVNIDPAGLTSAGIVGNGNVRLQNCTLLGKKGAVRVRNTHTVTIDGCWDWGGDAGAVCAVPNSPSPDDYAAFVFLDVAGGSNWVNAIHIRGCVSRTYWYPVLATGDYQFLKNFRPAI
jgi:hypothetical protein